MKHEGLVSCVMGIGFATSFGIDAGLADGSTRAFLARGLCEREDWRNARGALCLASALDPSLPAARHRRPRALDAGAVERDCPDMPLTGALEDLG